MKDELSFHSHYGLRSPFFISCVRVSTFPLGQLATNKDTRVYSAYEHSLLLASPSGSGSLASPPTIDLPIDIIVELLASTFLTCVGVVLGSPQLRPIRWSVWAGKVEREGRKPRAWEEGAGNPFRSLDERLGFLDIRVHYIRSICISDITNEVVTGTAKAIC